MINYGFPLWGRRKCLRGEIDQFVRIMKLLSLLLFLTSMHLSATTFSQTVTLKVKKQPLSQVLMAIKQQTGYHIMYNDRYVNPHALVSVQASNRPLEEVLDKLLTPQSLTYYLKDQTVVIRPMDDEEGRPSSVVGKPHSQQQTITGRVTDHLGTAFPDVNVRVKGTTTVTTTNSSGDYRIEVVDDESVLVFSYLGFATIEHRVGDQAVINVSLVPQENQLEEVVTVGYGTVARKDLTGSVSTVSMGDLTKAPVMSF